MGIGIREWGLRKIYLVMRNAVPSPTPTMLTATQVHFQNLFFLSRLEIVFSVSFRYEAKDSSKLINEEPAVLKAS